MKKLFRLSMLLCFSLLFVACSKDPVTPKASMGFTEEEPYLAIEEDRATALFKGTVDYIGKIKSVTLMIGTDENLSDAKRYTTQLEGDAFSIFVPDLNPDAKYYYRYYIDYGVSPDYAVDRKSITTPPLPEPVVTAPTVVTENVTVLGVRGNVTDNGGAPITERGICWGTEPHPVISGSHTPFPITEGNDGMGSFLLLLDLDPGVYYVRAYAINSAGLPGYGDDLMLIIR